MVSMAINIKKKNLLLLLLLITSCLETLLTEASEFILSGDSDEPLFTFSILGFPKCGTSFLKNQLENIDGVYLYPTELCSFDETGSLYNELQGTNITSSSVRGFKCPKLLEEKSTLEDAIPFLTYGEEVKEEKNPEDGPKFIVQIRHPVSWYQSYYNYIRYLYYPDEIILDPDEMPARGCYKPHLKRRGKPTIRNVCIERTNFHYSLSRLGKTPMMNNTEEMKLFGNDRDLVRNMNQIPIPSNSKIFLIELSQFYDPNELIKEELRLDLAKFLRISPDKFPPLRDHKLHGDAAQQQSSKNLTPINLCDSKYDKVRSKILRNGKRASKWISKYLLVSDDVLVSSKSNFIEKLQEWSKDPCSSGSDGETNDHDNSSSTQQEEEEEAGR